MSIVDLLITIIVVTILVTIALASIIYLAYRWRAARRPTPELGATREAGWFFIRYAPGPGSRRGG